MKKSNRKRAARKTKPEQLDKLQRALLGVNDELCETIAWTAFVCDGLCGILAEHEMDIDSATYNGMRFASVWVKRRNKEIASKLEATRRMLREIVK